MKYSIMWTAPCVRYLTCAFGSSDRFLISRYDSGNYVIRPAESTRNIRVNAKMLERLFPGALHALRKSAGVREYAVS